MRLIRKDFVKDGSFCQRCVDKYNKRTPIRKGSAWIYEQGGREYIVGPTCRKEIPNWRDSIPDLTKGALEIAQEGSALGGGGGGGNTLDRESEEHSRGAEAYLYLRFRHLEEFINAPALEWQVEIWEQFQKTGELTVFERARMEGFIRKQKGKEFSLSHLAGVYAAKYWIEEYISRRPKNSFLPGALQFLKSQTALSPKQVGVVNKCFERSPITFRLKNEPFAWWNKKKRSTPSP